MIFEWQRTTAVQGGVANCQDSFALRVFDRVWTSKNVVIGCASRVVANFYPSVETHIVIASLSRERGQYSMWPFGHT